MSLLSHTLKWQWRSCDVIAVSLPILKKKKRSSFQHLGENVAPWWCNVWFLSDTSAKPFHPQPSLCPSPPPPPPPGEGAASAAGYGIQQAGGGAERAEGAWAGDGPAAGHGEAAQAGDQHLAGEQALAGVPAGADDQVSIARTHSLTYSLTHNWTHIPHIIVFYLNYISLYWRLCPLCISMGIQPATEVSSSWVSRRFSSFVESLVSKKPQNMALGGEV